jgi:integrase
VKFTQTYVGKLRPPEGKNDITIWDESMEGFGIRFRNGKPGVYVIQFRDRIKGKQEKITLGKVTKITLDAAQIAAKQHFAKIASGENPAEERRAAVSKVATTITIGQLVPKFIVSQEQKGRTKNYLDETRRSLFRIDDDGQQNAYFKELHQFAPDDVTRRMVAAELDEIAADHGLIAMTRCRAHLHKFWNWAIAKGYVDGGNPVTGTEKFNPKTRDRQHSEEELRLIWAASNDDNDFDVIQKLIMLTGARRSQIGQLKRAEVKHNEQIIRLQGVGRSKNGTTFVLPLSTQAMALITEVWDRRTDDTGYLFGEGGEFGFSGWSKGFAAFKKRLGDTVEDYWLHDYRRTFQNIAQDKLKIDLHITESCMNHVGGVAKAGAKKHYNFAEYADQKREAMQVWGDYIERIAKPQQSQLDERTAA